MHKDDNLTLHLRAGSQERKNRTTSNLCSLTLNLTVTVTIQDPHSSISGVYKNWQSTLVTRSLQLQERTEPRGSPSVTRPNKNIRSLDSN